MGYKAAVLAKVKRAELDLKTITHKLAGFKVAKSREKITAAEMHKVAQNVVKQTVSLKSKHRRVARLHAQHIAALKKEKKAAVKAKKGLRELVNNYGAKLKTLKTSLKTLRRSPEIGPAMAAKIAKAKTKREAVLRIASKAYTNLSGAVSRLKAMAVTQKSVKLKAPKGSITATAT